MISMRRWRLILMRGLGRMFPLDEMGVTIRMFVPTRVQCAHDY